MHDVHDREVPSTATTTITSADKKPVGGMAALDNVLANQPTAPAVAQVIESYPNDRNPMIEHLQQTMGNSFVHQVIAMLPKPPRDPALQAEIDRQLGIARKQERGNNSFEVITHEKPPDPLELQRDYIGSAQAWFRNASIELDEQDERLRDLLGVRDALKPEEIRKVIDEFHKEADYVAAKKEYDRAADNLVKTMGSQESKLEQLGGTPEEAIQNNQILAVAGLTGAVAAGMWLKTKGTIDPKSHEVTPTAAGYESSAAKLDSLLATIVSTISHAVTDRVRAAMQGEKTAQAQFKAAWEAIDDNVVEHVDQLEGAIELSSFKNKLGRALEAGKYADGGRKVTPELAAEIRALEDEAKELGPITQRIVTGVKSMMSIVASGIDAATGNFSAVMEKAKDVTEAAQKVNKLLRNEPTSRDAEAAEDQLDEIHRETAVKTATAELERKSVILDNTIKGLGLVGDVFSFIDDIKELKEDGHNPFRYISALSDMVATMGDALLFLPPPGDLVGAAISTLCHGISAISAFLGDVWASFEPPQVTKDRRKLLGDVRPGDPSNETLASVAADNNVHALAVAGISQDQIMMIVRDFPDMIKAEGAVQLFLETQRVMQSDGLAPLITDADGTHGWKRYVLSPISAYTFVHDAAYNFGGSIGTLSKDQTVSDESWRRTAALHWLGPTICQSGYGPGIYDISSYRVSGETHIKG